MARKSRFAPQPQESQQIKAIMTEAWIYGRISNENERSEDSIDNQIEIAKAYINEKNDLTLGGVFTDLGFSGTNFERPGYCDMLAGILRKQIHCVVVKDLSRLGRTYIEVGELLFDTFVEHNVRFVSVNDRYDSFADDAGRKKLLILFKNLVNHMYSKDLGKKIRSSFEMKQKKGELLGCVPPYGYMYTTEGGGKHLQIEPEAAKIVKLIFDMRLRGDSTIKITEYLNSNNIPNPRAHYNQLGITSNSKYLSDAIWGNSYICNLLVNEVYIGDQIQGKHERHGKKVRTRPKEEWVVHKDAHPAIVSREQFDAVQALIAEASEKYKKRGNTLDKNIYVGKIFCSRCGRAVIRQYHESKGRYKYIYQCRSCRNELSRTLGVGTIKTLPLEALENTVRSVIEKQINICLDMKLLLADISASESIVSKRQTLLNERSRYQKDATRAEEMLSAAYTHHLQGILDENEFALARLKFERDKQNAEVGFARAEQALKEYDIDTVQKNEGLISFSNFKGFTTIDETILDALVNKIIVTPVSNDVEVVLNFKDSFDKLDRLVAESEVKANDV